jgi:hypothetical protein
MLVPVTQVVRIKLAEGPNLDQAITNTCANRYAAGYHLAASFVLQESLVLIFEKDKDPG